MPDFEITLRLRYSALDGGQPVVVAYDRDPAGPLSQQQCVETHVLQSIPGVLPDADGDEAATLVGCEIVPPVQQEETGTRERIGDTWLPTAAIRAAAEQLSDLSEPGSELIAAALESTDWTSYVAGHVVAAALPHLAASLSSGDGLSDDERGRLWALETTDSERRELEGDHLDAIAKLGYELVTHDENDGPCFGCSLSRMLGKLSVLLPSGDGERGVMEFTPKEIQTLFAAMAGNYPESLVAYRMSTMRKLAKLKRDAAAPASSSGEPGETARGSLVQRLYEASLPHTVGHTRQWSDVPFGCAEWAKWMSVATAAVGESGDGIGNAELGRRLASRFAVGGDWTEVAYDARTLLTGYVAALSEQHEAPQDGRPSGDGREEWRVRMSDGRTFGLGTNRDEAEVHILSTDREQFGPLVLERREVHETPWRETPSEETGA